MLSRLGGGTGGRERDGQRFVIGMEVNQLPGHTMTGVVCRVSVPVGQAV